MITWIGLMAGDIWNYLDKKGGSDELDSIVKGLNASRDMVLMSLGWLSREGHVALKGDLPNATVRLTGK